jgi:hypothetical protein
MATRSTFLAVNSISGRRRRRVITLDTRVVRRHHWVNHYLARSTIMTSGTRAAESKSTDRPEPTRDVAIDHYKAVYMPRRF